MDLAAANWLSLLVPVFVGASLSAAARTLRGAAMAHQIDQPKRLVAMVPSGVSKWTGDGAFARCGAVTGAIIGAGLTWLQVVVHHRRERSGGAKYLAIRVVIAIDQFLDNCVAAVLADLDPLDDRTDPEKFSPLPDAYVEPDDVDWSSIDRELARELLLIPVRDRQLPAHLRAVAQHDSAIRGLRDRLLKPLSVDVNALAERLRRDYGVPPRGEDLLGTSEWLDRWAVENNRSPGTTKRG